MNDEVAEVQPPIAVEVAYATPHKQLIIALQVAAGTTALEAARQSGITGKFEGLDLTAAKLGVFGKVVPANHELSDGERVEIYRPLIIDPKELRKARADAAKARRAEEKSAAKKDAKN